MKNKKGYTLVEILVSLAVFLIIMVGGLAFFSYGLVDINLSGHYRQAKELAEQKLEELKGLPYASISGGSEQDIIVGNMSFDRITIVSPPEDEDFEDYMQEVEVTVSWTEKGATQEVRLATVIAK